MVNHVVANRMLGFHLARLSLVGFFEASCLTRMPLPLFSICWVYALIAPPMLLCGGRLLAVLVANVAGLAEENGVLPDVYCEIADALDGTGDEDEMQ